MLCPFWTDLSGSTLPNVCFFWQVASLALNVSSKRFEVWKPNLSGSNSQEGFSYDIGLIYLWTKSLGVWMNSYQIGPVWNTIALAKRIGIAWRTIRILLIKHGCAFCQHDKHCLTSTFCLSVSKAFFSFSQAKNMSSTCLCNGQTDKYCAW